MSGVDESLVKQMMRNPAEVREAARRLGSTAPAIKSRRGGLTRVQQDTFAFCLSYQERNGITPSFDEIKDHLGLASKSGVHRIVTAMEERGVIRRLPNRARSIELVAGSF